MRPAIIDTGSPVSLLPADIGEHCAIQIQGATTIGGLVRRKECLLDVKIGEIPLRFRDENSVTDELVAKVYLAPVKTVPLIIGFESILKQADISLRFSKNEAYMEFPQ